MGLAEIAFSLRTPEEQRGFLIDTLKGLHEQRVTVAEAISVVDAIFKMKARRVERKVARKYHAPKPPTDSLSKS